MFNVVSVYIVYLHMVAGTSVVRDHRYAVMMNDRHCYRYTLHNFEAICNMYSLFSQLKSLLCIAKE
jgi:hypothetical protein